MKTFILSFILSFCSLLVSAQSVISSVGGESEIATWTIGEIVTETIIRSDVVFSQGFNQPLKIGKTVILDVTNDKISFKAYPNPVIDQLKIDFSDAGSYHWELYDLEGKILQTGLPGQTGQKNNTIDFSNHQQGKYILKITSESISRSVIIIKN